MSRADMLRLASILAGLLVTLAASPPAGAQRTPAPAPELPHAQRGPEEVGIFVVDRHGRPLPGAEVRFAFEDEHDGIVPDASAPGRVRPGLRLESPPATDTVDHLLSRRPLVRPSAGGRVELTWPRERGLLIAGRHGELWGFRWFPRDWRTDAGRVHPSAEPLRLELVPDWDLQVRVVDGARTVRDLPVRVRCGAWSRARANTTTEDHLFLFRHLGFELRDASQPLVVSLATQLAPPVEVSLDPRRAPAGPVVLRLPPLGAVEVTVLEPDGQPSADPVHVGLSFAPPAEPASRRFDPSSGSTVGTLTSAGKARFGGVALGRELELVVGCGPALRRTIRSPAWAGETVSVSVVLPPREPAPLAPAGAPVTSEPEGSLSGRLLLDPGIPRDGIELLLRCQGQVGEERRSTWIDRDGRFSFEGISAGPARLEVWPNALWLRAFEEDLAVFTADLVVTPGVVRGEVHPPLADIDLTGKLFAHEIRLKGLERERPFHARAFFAEARSSLSPRAYHHAWQLPLVLVSPWKSIDLELFVPGYRRVSRLDVGARIEVELEPGIPVRLRLVTDGLLPEPPLHLKALLVPTRPGAERSQWGFDWEGPAFGADRQLVTTAWSPGLMEVVWIASRELPDSRSSSGVHPDVFPPQYVDVLDSPFEQVFEVSISAEELARLLRQEPEPGPPLR